MVIVQDDIAIPDISRPRGVAGTLFVHKIAGAESENGGDLEAVTAVARRAASKAKSIGMSLDTCTMPGSNKEVRIRPGEIELGLGIHGEAGVLQMPYLGARQAMAHAVAKLQQEMTAGGYVALLNNLGSTTELEMSILAEELRRSVIGSAISHIVGPAAMMTALDMHGFSLSLFPMDAEDEKLLTAKTPVRAWPGLTPFNAPRLVPLPEGLTHSRAAPSGDPRTEAFLRRSCQALIDAEADLNALDAKAGDGDTGSTLASAARALIRNMGHLPLSNHAQLCRALGHELSQTMGGSSGVLLAVFFAAAGEAASAEPDLIGALKVGLARMQEVGGAKPGDRTMVDALLPALDVLPQGLRSAATAAREGANRTAAMRKAHAGRAAYINADQLEGYADPGAEAIARLFEGVLRVETA
jgi:dihydroxyacetone kinase